MDGARFANALVYLGASPGRDDMEAGRRLLSFGGTKNGCMAPRRCLLRSAMAAMRLICASAPATLLKIALHFAAQFEAYLRDGPVARPGARTPTRWRIGSVRGSIGPLLRGLLGRPKEMKFSP
jgi:threonine aldolase